MTDLTDFPAVGELFLGRYRIESILGSGGFARVYRAVQEDLDREVAIKVMRPAVDASAEDTEETRNQIQLVERRFRREARVISKFRSPHTVVVHDYGRTDGGLLFMTLEYVDGKTVADLIKEAAPMDGPRVIRIVSQVLESLHEAHAFDILHRDIKPQNIMVFDHLEQRDLVKVLDFGIAKVLEVEEDPAGTNELTSDGVLVGTPRYMSPEQIRGDDLAPSSDVYSLGLVMYEMLCGRKAVDEPTTMRIIARHLDPKPLTVPDEVEIGESLRILVERMVSKAPADRYQSARETLTALRAWDPINDDAVTSDLAADEDVIPTAVLAPNAAANALSEDTTPPEDDYEVPATTVIEQPSFPEDRPASSFDEQADEQANRPTVPSTVGPLAGRDRQPRPTPRLDERFPEAVATPPADPTTEELPESRAQHAAELASTNAPVHQLAAPPDAWGDETGDPDHDDDRTRKLMLPLIGLVAVLAVIGGTLLYAVTTGDTDDTTDEAGLAAKEVGETERTPEQRAPTDTAELAAESAAERAAAERAVEEKATDDAPNQPDEPDEVADVDEPRDVAVADAAPPAGEVDERTSGTSSPAKTEAGAEDDDERGEENRVTRKPRPAKKEEKKPKRRFFSVE